MSTGTAKEKMLQKTVLQTQFLNKLALFRWPSIEANMNDYSSDFQEWQNHNTYFNQLNFLNHSEYEADVIAKEKTLSLN